jgi:PAS domain S-box-containing protein
MQEERETNAELRQEPGVSRPLAIEPEQAEREIAAQMPQNCEQKYRSLITNIPHVEWTTDCGGNTTFISPNVEKVCGYSPEEIYKQGDRRWFGRIHPDDVEKAKQAYKALFEKGTQFDIEYRIKKRDGQWIWLHDRSLVIYEKDGVMCADGIFCDVTERKETEDALRQSENKYRTLLENLPQKIFLKDTNSVYISCNENYASDLNIKSDEIAGKTDYDFYPRELAEKYRTDDQTILKSGQTTRIEEKYTQCGQDLIVETVKTPVRDEKGNVAGILGIFWDITQKKKAEDEIRKLSSAVEQSIDGIAIGDLEPRLVYVNEAFARMHGYSPEEMIGMRVARLHNREQMAAFKKRLDQIRTRGAWEGEIGHIRRDGTPFPTYVSVTLLNNDRGEPTGILAVTRDITESKQIKKELSAHREKMVRAEQLASLGTLSATLARELTQPLTVIRLSIENSLAELETMACPGNVIEDLKEGLSEVPTIISIVNRFRDFARRPSKKTLSEVDLKKVVERVVRLLDESAWRAKVTLRVEGMDKLPPIYSYQKDLEQLIFALVENAIQAADGKKNRRVSKVEHPKWAQQCAEDRVL